jgi:hypothetical protein
MKNGGNDLNVPTDLPTLFVGWNHFKNTLTHFHGDKVNILNKEIKIHKMYWEFSFDENKQQHIGGIEMFVRNVPYFFFRSKYAYINIDPIFNNIEQFEDIVSNIIGKPEYAYSYKDEMLYLLTEDRKRVYGINLKMYEYFNMDVNYIKKGLIEIADHHTSDLDGSIYLEMYKLFPNFEELKRYLVVLLSKA